jgi:hypothetical protein
MPVQASQSTSHAAQVASLVAPQAAVWYWPAPQTLHAPQVTLLDPPHAAVWYWPAAQVEQVLQTVSLVAVQADAWNWPMPQVAQATQELPTRWYPGAHELQVEASLQVAQPAGQAPHVASVVAVQAAVWYWPPAQVAHALHTTPSPVKPVLQPQLKLPGVFEQFAFVEQFAVPELHSLMSTQPPAPPPV